jgi:hypothetical protein
MRSSRRESPRASSDHRVTRASTTTAKKAVVVERYEAMVRSVGPSEHDRRKR